MNKLLLVFFIFFLVNVPASSQAMFRARMNTAIGVVKSYYQPLVQVVEKPFLARIQKSVEKRFPEPQFKSHTKPEYKTPVLHSHKKLVTSLSNSKLSLWQNGASVFSSAFGIARANLVLAFFPSLAPNISITHAGITLLYTAFCYFGTKNIMKDYKETLSAKNKLSAFTQEHQCEFKLYEDIQ